MDDFTKKCIKYGLYALAVFFVGYTIYARTIPTGIMAVVCVMFAQMIEIKKEKN